MKIKGLKCRECNKAYPAEPLHVCEFCFGPLEVVYHYDSIRSKLTREKISGRPKTLWRYWELLPVETQELVSLQEGFTPFWKSRNLGKFLGLKNLYIKTDIGVLDILGELPGVGSFEEIAKRAGETSFGGKKVKVLSLDDLIKSKMIVGREKDKATVLELKVIKEKLKKN